MKQTSQSFQDHDLATLFNGDADLVAFARSLHRHDIVFRNDIESMSLGDVFELVNPSPAQRRKLSRLRDIGVIRLRPEEPSRTR